MKNINIISKENNVLEIFVCDKFQKNKPILIRIAVFDPNLKKKEKLDFEIIIFFFLPLNLEIINT